MVRFYTYPPVNDYQWVLRNIKQKPKKDFLHEIVDIGIYDLLYPPYKHSEEKLKQWKQLKPNGWKVVPDCPDIIGEFSKTIFNNLQKVQKKIKKYNLGIYLNIFIDYWWNYVNNMDNTKYSWELLVKLYDPNDKSQIPVIQSKYNDKKSLIKYCRKFKQHYGIVEKIAVGSVCKLKSDNIASHMLYLVRLEFPNTWIHAFGLRFKALRKSYSYINSYDSTAWTFPRTS